MNGPKGLLITYYYDLYLKIYIYTLNYYDIRFHRHQGHVDLVIIALVFLDKAICSSMTSMRKQKFSSSSF